MEPMRRNGVDNAYAMKTRRSMSAPGAMSCCPAPVRPPRAAAAPVPAGAALVQTARFRVQRVPSLMAAVNQRSVAPLRLEQRAIRGRPPQRGARVRAAAPGEPQRGADVA
jgi:hypothetical protein